MHRSQRSVHQEAQTLCQMQVDWTCCWKLQGMLTVRVYRCVVPMNFLIHLISRLFSFAASQPTSTDEGHIQVARQDISSQPTPGHSAPQCSRQGLKPG
ncbi:hypothetical protein V5799_022554 [Amblyomma americanum]|uniref:Uncharacterized protein n=1 Tax=Amblyomma americanum TaxID=6943 RepID=A0AAQ4FKJ1_AMBAM